jgi:cytochrome P450
MISHYETVHLYRPAVFIPRAISTESTTLKLKGKEYTLPPKTFIIVSTGSLHTTPTIWGSDSMSFPPDRRISKVRKTTDLEHEVMKPMPVAYLPRSIGPRSCTGKKFAKVEFVAVIANLFRRHRVKAVVEPGEKKEKTEKMIFEVLRTRLWRLRSR